MSVPTVVGQRRDKTAAGKRQRRDAFSGGTPLVYLLAVIVVVFSLGPVFFGVIGGFRTNAQIAADSAGMPDPWVFFNYADALTNPTFWRFTLNSLAVATITTVIVVTAGMMAAYPLARYKFRGREAIFMVFVAGLLFPLTVAVIPLFILISQNLGLSNTWWGIALPQAAFALPMTVVILRPFLIALPNEIEEAAMIDGASRFYIFLRIVLPLATPALLSVTLFAFTNAWNEFLFALIFTFSQARTMPILVAGQATQHGPQWWDIAVMALITVAPLVLITVFLWRRLLGGLLAGWGK
jgi:raffinose/stachyose/melibiose transport system permease protein